MSQWTVACQAPLSMESSRQNTGVGCRSLLQGIIPTQGSNSGLLHGRWILYRQSQQGSPSQHLNQQTLKIILTWQSIFSLLVTGPWLCLEALKRVARWCPTLCDPMHCSLPSSSVPGILQARILEGCHSLLQGIFPTQGSNPISCIAGRFFTG